MLIGQGVFMIEIYNLIPWSAKKQATVTHSSIEAEYKSMANGPDQLTGLKEPTEEDPIG